MPIKSYTGKTFGGLARPPLVSEGLNVEEIAIASPSD